MKTLEKESVVKDVKSIKNNTTRLYNTLKRTSNVPYEEYYKLEGIIWDLIRKYKDK